MLTLHLKIVWCYRISLWDLSCLLVQWDVLGSLLILQQHYEAAMTSILNLFMSKLSFRGWQSIVLKSDCRGKISTWTLVLVTSKTRLYLPCSQTPHCASFVGVQLVDQGTEARWSGMSKGQNGIEAGGEDAAVNSTGETALYIYFSLEKLLTNQK